MGKNMSGQICLNQSVLAFMEKMMTPESWVLEIGGGYSSRWFADRCHQLTIVETNATWRRTIAHELVGADCHVTISSRIEDVQGYEGADLALVDCLEALRYQAAKTAWQVLGPGGWLVFDDAQRPKHAETISWLYRHGGSAVALDWQPGDIETARERVALAWQKPI